MTRSIWQGILETEWAKRPVLPPPGRQSSVNLRRASSEVDIDGGMSESEPANENSRMAQSEEIVKQLEKSVPRWEGFGPGGWSTTIQLVCFPPSRPWHHVSTRGSRRTLCQLFSKYGITRMQSTCWRSPAMCSWFQHTSIVGPGSVPPLTQSLIWIRNLTFRRP